MVPRIVTPAPPRPREDFVALGLRIHRARRRKDEALRWMVLASLTAFAAALVAYFLT